MAYVNDSDDPKPVNILEPNDFLTTSDLVCWSFQIANGMRYLASHKVVHGDLSARNIYVCEDNTVKIGDFGLAQSLFKTDAYLKKKEVSAPKILKNMNYLFKKSVFSIQKGASTIQVARN